MNAVETGYAKINLALHVRRRAPDGYHAIETLFAFAEEGDLLSLSEAAGLRVTGPFAAALEGGANLVLRAADAFAAMIGRPVDTGFQLDKRLPVAAGIGGGSADAAAALRLLCRRYGVDESGADVWRVAAALGGDVPACRPSRPMRGGGRGARLTPAGGAVGGVPLLLVNPMRPLTTGSVFARWDGVDRGPLAEDDVLRAAERGRNDLEAPAIAILPVIGTVLGLLAGQEGVRLSRMSGSGATCFALFEDEPNRDRAAATIAAAHPDWWLLRTRLR